MKPKGLHCSSPQGHTSLNGTFLRIRKALGDLRCLVSWSTQLVSKSRETSERPLALARGLCQCWAALTLNFTTLSPSVLFLFPCIFSPLSPFSLFLPLLPHLLWGGTSKATARCDIIQLAGSPLSCRAHPRIQSFLLRMVILEQASQS